MGRADPRLHVDGSIISWLPLFLFVVLFGLSMDYHVFILSRVREGVDSGLTTDEAVRHGITVTAGVVTSAALVMVGVFSLFGSLSSLELKQSGVGLATAVLIDATIVRAVLLPSTMKLLGERTGTCRAGSSAFRARRSRRRLCASPPSSGPAARARSERGDARRSGRALHVWVVITRSTPSACKADAGDGGSGGVPGHGRDDARPMIPTGRSPWPGGRRLLREQEASVAVLVEHRSSSRALSMV